MKAKRFLFLVMAICLASGVRAQFYDGPDDIYYYLLESENGKTVSKNNQRVYIFNFDGRKAAMLNLKPNSPDEKIADVQANLQRNPDYYAEKVETTKYDMEYKSSSYKTVYELEYTSRVMDTGLMPGHVWVTHYNDTFEFSSDRNTLILDRIRKGHMANGTPTTHNDKLIFKKVDKSFFRVGRSRTPSGTIYE